MVGMGTSAGGGGGPGLLFLPGPTGPYAVGMTSLWLTDASRPDPWATEVSARELMVSLWYPAEPSETASQLGPRESRRLEGSVDRLECSERVVAGLDWRVGEAVRGGEVDGVELRERGRRLVAHGECAQ